jgi:DNA/RNA-binding domain of Phe-tRNA-synthetase-like protein
MDVVPAFARDPALDPLDIPVAFLIVRGFERTRPTAALAAACAGFVTELLAQRSLDELSAEAELAGYRELHTRIGRSGRQYLPSPESLFRQIYKRGAWRPIEPLVDAYSLVSLRTRVSIGAHDLTRLRLPVRLASTRGGEPFLPIGERTPRCLGAGEYAYLDADDLVLGRMECRQAQATCVGADTRDLLFILQGHAALPGARLRSAATELIDTLGDLVGNGSVDALSVVD